MAAQDGDDAGHKEAYAIVGELVLISNALDYMLAEVLISVLNLGQAIMIMPVVMTLDPARKSEILKAHASHITQSDWKRGVTGFVDKVEKVFKYRNIACHTQPIFENGKWTLRPFAAAKMLKTINVEEKTIAAILIDDLKDVIKTAEAALGIGVELKKNFERVNEEVEKRRSKKSNEEI